jgi:hypothetical protein
VRANRLGEILRKMFNLDTSIYAATGTVLISAA